MLTIGQSTFAALTLLALVLAGAVWTLGLANFNIAIQLSSPRWVTGRMLATYQTVAFAGMAFGSWGWGVLAERVGIRESLSIAAFSALVRWCRPLGAGLGRLAGFTRPACGPGVAPPKVDIHPASGRIVAVYYRVPPQNAREFIDVMNELGRIRRRDGAALSACQDIDDPQYWVERFESPTWLDYLRRQTRPTESDFEVRKRIGRLIVGEKGRVRRFRRTTAGRRTHRHGTRAGSERDRRWRHGCRAPQMPTRERTLAGMTRYNDLAMSIDNLLLTAVGLLLVLLNGFFVAAEFAIVKLRRTQAEELARTHGLRGRVLRTV